jgi:hypothetical protein
MKEMKRTKHMKKTTFWGERLRAGDHYALPPAELFFMSFVSFTTFVS